MLLCVLAAGGVHSHAVFASAAALAAPRLRGCLPRDLAWLASSFAAAGFRHDGLFAAIAAEVVARADSVDRKELAWLARAFTTLQGQGVPKGQKRVSADRKELVWLARAFTMLDRTKGLRWVGSP
eukprot:352771-Chlamydomonas_euryale.AAC.1